MLNLVDSTIQENATLTRNRESQSKTGTFEGKHNMTENFVFDLADVITGRKIISELTCEEKYYYLTKHYCRKGKNSLFKKQFIKGGETKNLTYQLS